MSLNTVLRIIGAEGMGLVGRFEKSIVNGVDSTVHGQMFSYMVIYRAANRPSK